MLGFELRGIELKHWFVSFASKLTSPKKIRGTKA
jgi:hypothetical protein